MTGLALSEAVPLAYVLVDRVADNLGIRVLFIKGPVAQAQELRGPQASVDADVLVDPAQRGVLTAGLSELGWIDDNPHKSPRVLPLHSWTYRNPRWPCELDVHHQFPGLFADPQAAFDLLWERRDRAEIAGREIPVPDVAGHALILALHALRDPYRTHTRLVLSELEQRLETRFDVEQLRELAVLAHRLGAADTARPFLSLLGAPPVGVGTTPDTEMRAWRLRTSSAATTSVSWVEQLRRLPWRARPAFLWYAMVLSEKELRLADPSLAAGRLAVQRARIRRLRRGLAAVPSAIRQVTSVRGGTADNTSIPARARVVIIQEILTSYRIPFYAALRQRLTSSGVELTVVHGFAHGSRATRGDQAELPGAVTTVNRHFELVPGTRAAVWQPVPRRILRRADVVVVEQASRQLVNYVLLARYLVRGRPRLVMWGHGENLQTSGSLAARASERLKRAVSTRPHWWLAYTEGSADRVAALGYPRERITVVQNAVEVRRPDRSVDRLPGRCVYVGSLYPDKRIGYLLEAGRRMVELDPRFCLVIIGDGEDRGVVEAAAEKETWLEYRGSLFGEEQAAELSRAQLLLMPGLVGLAIVDSFVLECPMVTVDHPFHSPEVEYLEDDVNGLLLPSGTAPRQYAAEVAALLGDTARLERLRSGCRESAAKYTIEAMADRYAEGLLAALQS